MGRGLYAGVRGKAHGASNMIKRLWPKGLVGQLVVAIALALFVAQAVNFTMLARSQEQRAIAHGSGMIVARIADTVERERNGDGNGAGDVREGIFGADDNAAMPPAAEERGAPRGPDDMRGAGVGHGTGRADQGHQDHGRAEPDRPDRAMRMRITDTPVALPKTAELREDVGKYVSDRLAEAGVHASSVRAWAMPRRAPDGPYDLRGPIIYVSAAIDGQYYTARGRLPYDGGGLRGFLFWQTLMLYLLLLGPIMWIAWRAAKPLRELTRAARATPLMRDHDPVPEAGPSDVRELTRAFNMYRARIDRMLSDKDRMLGAVGHDLRTPLASLRVRVEQVDKDVLREKMIASIDEMTLMLTDILALARSGAGTEEPENLSAQMMMQELADEFHEQGQDVQMDAASPDIDTVIQVRPLLLRRALRNLISNAVLYGVRARLSVVTSKDAAELIISDDGPGLSDEQIVALMEPFARGEISRNRATGGSGLGLSIARDIAEGEGGALELRRRDGGGLDAVVRLPR